MHANIIHDAKYGNTGCGVSRSGMHNPKYHTAGLDTIFVQIYMNPPPGVPGVSRGAPGSTKHAI